MPSAEALGRRCIAHVLYASVLPVVITSPSMYKKIYYGDFRHPARAVGSNWLIVITPASTSRHLELILSPPLLNSGRSARARGTGTNDRCAFGPLGETFGYRRPALLMLCRVEFCQRRSRDTQLHGCSRST